MQVVITGGAGFIGRALARRLLARGRLTAPSGREAEIDSLVLFDAAAPEEALAGLDGRARLASGDVADRDTVFGLIGRDDVSIFHLASVVSAGAEADFDLALRVNLDGTLNVLDAARARAGRPRLLFASSIAVFGGEAMPESVSDTTKETPDTTYGMTKAASELLVNDYSRKGFLDGRSARLPTVIVRPGRPNLAASSFASGVIREPLNGEECVLPVGRGTRMPVAGHRTVVDGMIALHEADEEALGRDRAVNLPSLSVTVEEMIAALERVAAGRALGPIRDAPDPRIEAIVRTWPGASEWSRATALGMKRDRDIDSIIRAYIEDFAPA